MTYCIVLTQPRYCPHTDAILGTTSSILAEFGTFETAAWADTKAFLLERKYGDSDFAFTARPSDDPFNFRRGRVVPTPLSISDDGDDIPF